MDSTGPRSAKRWWVTTAGQNPRGPMSATELVASIGSGEVESALVCEVGGSAWVALIDVAEIEMVLRRRDVDIRDGSKPGLAAFDDELPEHTMVGRPPFDSLPGAGEGESDDDDMPTIRPAPPDDWE